VVVPAAAQYGVFVGIAQARHGLARIKQADARAFELLGVAARQVGDAAEVAHEVEDHALGAEDLPGGAGNAGHDGTLGDLFPFLGKALPCVGKLFRVRRAQIHDQRDDGQPGDDRLFFGYDNRLKPVPGAEDALGGEIRPILGEGEFQDRQKVHPRLALKIF